MRRSVVMCLDYFFISNFWLKPYKCIFNLQYAPPQSRRRATAAGDDKKSGRGHKEMAISQELMAAFTLTVISKDLNKAVTQSRLD